MKSELQAKVKQSKKVISDQCVNGHWQMCAPVQKDDSDIVLNDTLDALVNEINRLENLIKPVELKSYLDKSAREKRFL